MQASIAAIDDTQLPPQLRRLVRAIGLPATLALLKARGGTRLMLGKNPAGASLLLDLIGHANTKALLAAFEGATELMLPKADKLLAQARDRAIRDEHARGHSLMVLALRYDLTSRHILNIISGQPQASGESAQAGLF